MKLNIAIVVMAMLAVVACNKRDSKTESESIVNTQNAKIQFDDFDWGTSADEVHKKAKGSNCTENRTTEDGDLDLLFRWLSYDFAGIEKDKGNRFYTCRTSMFDRSAKVEYVFMLSGEQYELAGGIYEFNLTPKDAKKESFFLGEVVAIINEKYGSDGKEIIEAEDKGESAYLNDQKSHMRELRLGGSRYRWHLSTGEEIAIYQQEWWEMGRTGETNSLGGDMHERTVRHVDIYIFYLSPALARSKTNDDKSRL